MSDATESIRRAQLVEINAEPQQRELLETKFGQVWNTAELIRDFEVLGLLAPYVAVRRKADAQVGSLAFQHDPRLYFAFRLDQR